MKITVHNYEAYALDYIEGTLSVEDCKAFGQFLETHPEIAAQVRDLQDEMPTLTPDISVIYTDKAGLKRKASIRPLFVRAAAVAAVLLVGVLVFNRFQQAVEDPSQPAVQPLLSEQLPTTPERILPAETATLADAQPAPVKLHVPIPAAKIEPMAKADPLRDLTPDVSTMKPVSPRSVTQEETTEPAVRETREMITLLPEYLDQPLQAVHALEPEHPADKTVRLALSKPAGQLVPVPEEYRIESINEPVVLASGRKNQAGLLNVLGRRGFKKIASGIIAPLSEISPIKVYNDNEERVVEFASIPISRKSNKLEE